MWFPTLMNLSRHTSHPKQSCEQLYTIVALFIVYLNIKRSLYKFSSSFCSNIMISLLQPLDLLKEDAATHDNGPAPVSSISPASKPPSSPATNLHAIVLALRAITVLKTASTSATTRVAKTTPIGKASSPAVSHSTVHPVYQPVPLRCNEFRILHVEPATSFSSQIVARLSVVDYDPKSKEVSAPYDALSYRWGDPNDTVKIVVNDAELKVTRNLSIALQNLRHQDRELVIWTDAICINQMDIEERQVQVTLMGVIYSKADCVQIWLGEASLNTEAGMDLANSCGNKETAEVVKKICADDRGSSGLTELLERPYWSRIWMFQEILLSGKARVQCGRFSTPFGHLKYLDMVTSQSSLWRDRKNPPGWTIRLRKAFFNTAQFTISPKALNNLERILVLTRPLQATEARDKLFALMGTCDMAPYLSVDYSKSLRDIYVEFARHYAQKTGSLALFLLAGSQNPDDQPDIGLPSWTPDFRSSTGVDIYTGYGIENAGTFNATKGKRYMEGYLKGHTTGDADGVFVAEGLLLDTIQTTVPVLKDAQTPKQLLTVLQFGQLNHHLGVLGKPQIEALFESLVFDTNGYTGEDSEARIATKQHHRLNYMLGFMRDLETYMGNELPRKQDGNVDFNTLFGSKGGSDLPYVTFYESIKRTDPSQLDVHYKTFMKEFLLKSGRASSMFVSDDNKIGRCNVVARPGDAIALLFGCPFPVVLRRQELGFELVGACYISGMMYGELMNGNSSYLTVQEIPLV
ncbi:heterokaryon incompatibility protein-domain-containing protein [Colletotrichum phormii]|uniref:Heterokaryon incompatibility protein-domain-containing protein n=1 Tax=Colletotrichum phormii TaxID=359342 RepID=A0AAJ0A276_9PEZI|nr:heterokaryon incompatibility protein-domain-containing protein [Colletotrichum phormii]KAK1655115.1 heterokaryon incompatibility protein-domain-containing protein [Colletotrichum phormii]